MEHNIDLNKFADGALAERFNEELLKVLDNIADPNTEPHKNRSITVTVNIHGDENRDVVNASVVAKSKLLPAKEVQTKILMGSTDEGIVVGKELRSGVKGQMFFDGDGDVARDTGEKVEEDSNRVISFREQVNAEK